MLMKITNPGRPWLVLALLASSFVTGNASSQTQAQERPAVAAKTIDLDIEVWELSDSMINEIGELDQFGGPWMSRLGLLGNLKDQKDKPKETPPTRFRMKTKDGQVTHLNMNKMTMDADASLLMELKPTLVGRDEIALDYEMVCRTKSGEVKVSAKQHVAFGNLMTQWIKPKPSDDAGSQEKSWLVLMSPRHRTADGSDVVIAVDSRKETNAAGVAFMPRPGKFEMQVAEGWSGHLLVNSMDSPLVRLSGTTNVGASKDAKASDHYVPLETFRAERPVLEVVYADDGFIQLVARRSGVASVRCQVPDLDGKSATCELQIVVSPDTTEIDRAIKEALPQASIKVTNVKDAALLTGSVTKEDDLKLLLEVAEQFYPKVINRVKVAAQPAQPKERLGHGSPVAPWTGVSPATGATPTSQPELEAASRRVTPTVATEPPQNRPRRRDRPELKALHDDVRALREDVRRLSELLEKRLATKDLPREVPGNSEAVPQTDTRGKFEATVPPNALLYFTATWCGPCQKMQPLVNRIVRDGGSIQTIDIDKDAALAKRFNVLSIPCFIRLEEGKEVKRVTGMDSERRLRELATFSIHQQLVKALEKEVELNFNDTPLNEAIRAVGEKIGANFVVDSRSLDEEGIKVTTPVSIVVSGLSARPALRLILKPLHLTYVVKDEVIMIVSRQRAKGELIVTTYAVADLLAIEPAGVEKTDAPHIESGLKQFIEVIQSTVSPDSWDVAGGSGSVRSYATTRSLVIRQTRDVHDEIANLLQRLRELKRVSDAGGKVHEAVPSTKQATSEALATDGVVKLSASGKRAKPVSLLVGQRGKLEFAGRIQSVEGHDGAILQLSRVAGESLLVQGASVGATLLRVSVDGVAEPFEVVVVVSPVVVESNTTQIILRADDAQPRKVSLRVNRSLEVTVNDRLTRVDGFDPHLVDVKAVEKDRLRFTGSTAGTTTATLTTRSGKSHTVEVTVLAAEAWKQHPLVRQRIAVRDDLPRPIRVPLKGERPIELDADVNRISIGPADVMDVRQMDPRHVVVLGEKTGVSQLTFWFENNPEPLVLFVESRLIVQEEEDELLGIPKAEGAERYVPVK